MSDTLKVDGGPLPSAVPIPGMGPVSVDTLLIESQAARVGMAAARTAAVGAELAQLASDPALIATAALDVVGAARVLARISDAGIGRNGIAPNVARLTAHAGRVTASAAAYEVTEGQVGYLFSTGSAWINDAAIRAMSSPSPQVREAAAKWLLLSAAVEEVGDVLTDMRKGKPVNEAIVGNAEDFARKAGELLISQLPLLFGPPFTVEHTARRILFISQGLGLDGPPHNLILHPPTKPHPLKVAPGRAGMLDGLKALERSEKKGTVTVQRFKNSAGDFVYVVNIPGTQGEWGGKNPADWLTNVQEKAGMKSDMRKLVERALEDIPPESSVMLNGYSQGGIVATNIALDPSVRRRLNVKAVNTLGSPVGDVTGKMPPGTVTMNIEHPDDPVPMADGRRAVPGPNHYVARVDSPDRLTPGPDGPHKFKAYANTVDRLAQSKDPNALRYAQQTAEFQAAQNAESTVREYRAERVPK